MRLSHYLISLQIVARGLKTGYRVNASRCKKPNKCKMLRAPQWQVRKGTVIYVHETHEVDCLRKRQTTTRRFVVAPFFVSRALVAAARSSTPDLMLSIANRRHFKEQPMCRGLVWMGRRLPQALAHRLQLKTPSAHEREQSTQRTTSVPKPPVKKKLRTTSPRRAPRRPKRSRETAV